MIEKTMENFFLKSKKRKCQKEKSNNSDGENKYFFCFKILFLTPLKQHITKIKIFFA